MKDKLSKYEVGLEKEYGAYMTNLWNFFLMAHTILIDKFQ